jgi:hypothetical protein
VLQPATGDLGDEGNGTSTDKIAEARKDSAEVNQILHEIVT